MPLVAHSQLPTFDQLRARGQDVLALDKALHQDIRELHIGLLNMMPDAALTVTERQYMRLLGSCNQIVQLYVHPFSIPGLSRSTETQAYIDQHYADFDQLRDAGLDALIISGANVSNPSIDLEPFWHPLQEVISWATHHVTGMLCSCLASHALVKHLHEIDRHGLAQKQWGVYGHRVRDRSHPLMKDVNTRFDAPHSRWNKITRDDLEAAGLHVLVESDEAGVHLAVSPDQFRIVYFQGHPEYDHNSLLKEYKREMSRFFHREIDHPPPYPENYFSADSREIAEAYLQQALDARSRGDSMPAFPEGDFEFHIDNTWIDTGKAIFNNWLGLIYKLTHHQRHLPFQPGVNPDDPLGRRNPQGATE